MSWVGDAGQDQRRDAVGLQPPHSWGHWFNPSTTHHYFSSSRNFPRIDLSGAEEYRVRPIARQCIVALSFTGARCS